MLKIPLADPQTELPELRSPRGRIASSLKSIGLTFGATDDATYREIAKKSIESSPKTNHDKTYSCLHPNWFDEPQVELKLIQSPAPCALMVMLVHLEKMIDHLFDWYLF